MHGIRNMTSVYRADTLSAYFIHMRPIYTNASGRRRIFGSYSCHHFFPTLKISFGSLIYAVNISPQKERPYLISQSILSTGIFVSLIDGMEIILSTRTHTLAAVPVILGPSCAPVSGEVLYGEKGLASKPQACRMALAWAELCLHRPHCLPASAPWRCIVLQLITNSKPLLECRAKPQ